MLRVGLRLTENSHTDRERERESFVQYGQQGPLHEIMIMRSREREREVFIEFGQQGSFQEIIIPVGE